MSHVGLQDLTPEAQRGPEAVADGVVQDGGFDGMLLGGEFGEPEVENGLRLHRQTIAKCKRVNAQNLFCN